MIHQSNLIDLNKEKSLKFVVVVRKNRREKMRNNNTVTRILTA